MVDEDAYQMALDQAAEGRSNAGIARQLYISEGTVENTCAAS
jgi:DNA-binding NarL/FixJ family response regulator